MLGCDDLLRNDRAQHIERNVLPWSSRIRVLEEFFVKGLLIVEDECSTWYVPGSDYPMVKQCHIPVCLRFCYTLVQWQFCFISSTLPSVIFIFFDMS